MRKDEVRRFLRETEGFAEVPIEPFRRVSYERTFFFPGKVVLAGTVMGHLQSKVYGEQDELEVDGTDARNFLYPARK